MSSPANQSITHITFKRDRKSANYVAEKSYLAASSPYRVSPSRRRNSSGILNLATGKDIPTLEQVVAESSSRAASRARSVRSRTGGSVRPTPGSGRRERTSIAEERSRRGEGSGSGTPAAAEEGEREASSLPQPTQDLPPSSAPSLAPALDLSPHQPPQPPLPQLETIQDLRLALLTTQHTPSPSPASQQLLTRLILHSTPYLPPSPPVPLLTHSILRLLSPSPLPQLLPQLLQLLSQLELHRLLLVSQAREVLALHEQIQKGSPGRLGREERRRLREVGSEKVGDGQRKKWFALGLHLRKTYVREQLTLNPYTPASQLLEPLFPPPLPTPSLSSATTTPPQPTLLTTTLSSQELASLATLRHRCEQMIQEVALWASSFRGTPQEAQREFEGRWPMVPDWTTTTDIVRGYCDEVLGAEDILRGMFEGDRSGKGERGSEGRAGSGAGAGAGVGGQVIKPPGSVKIEPLRELRGPKMEPISPAVAALRGLV